MIRVKLKIGSLTFWTLADRKDGVLIDRHTKKPLVGEVLEVVEVKR